MNKYLIPSILVSLLSLAPMPLLADSPAEEEISKEDAEFARERERQLAKKLSPSERRDAQDEFEAQMAINRDILAVLKKIRHDDDINEGRRELKRLAPPSTSDDTYERMANPQGSAGGGMEADDSEDMRTVDEIRRERALGEVKQKNIEVYNKLIANLDEEINRILDSDLQSYELTLMLEDLQEKLGLDSEDDTESDSDDEYSE